MKKEYIHPQIVVLEIEVQQLLSASPDTQPSIKGSDIPEEDDEYQIL